MPRTRVGNTERLEGSGLDGSKVAGLPWDQIRTALWNTGYGRTGPLLSRVECENLRSLYGAGGVFRSKVDMARHRFGRGEYKYFAYPLPPLVADLRQALYARLFETANEWTAALSISGDYPPELGDFLAHCKEHGQSRPTPLMLRYKAGDYNCLHQDLYGDVVFPFQVVFCLSAVETEFTGGELLMVEQQPRAQSIGHAIRMGQGEGVVITTRYRPVKGSRGYYRTNLRHGVSPVLSGERYTMGIIFHDAA